MKEKLCFFCLNKGHRSSDCSRKNPCCKPNCKGYHATLLHPPDKVASCRENASDKTNEECVNISSGFIGAASAKSSGLLLVMPVKVRLRGSERTILTQALLDNGSTNFFITNSLIKELCINDCPEVKVNTTTLCTQTQEYKKSKVVRNLEICDLSQSNLLPLNDLLSTEKIPVSLDDIPSQIDINNFSEFSDIFIPQVDCNVGLLVGNDNLQVLQTHDVITTPSGC